MNTDNFKRVDGELHKWGVIPCPDGREGCMVAHFGWTPFCPVNRQKELFEELKGVGFRVQGLGSIVQNEGVVYSQREIDGWERRVSDCIQDLMLLKDEVVEFAENNKREVLDD